MNLTFPVAKALVLSSHSAVHLLDKYGNRGYLLYTCTFNTWGQQCFLLPFIFLKAEHIQILQSSPWMSSAPVLVASVASEGHTPLCKCHAGEIQPREVAFPDWLTPCLLVQPQTQGHIPAWGCCQPAVLRACSAELLPPSEPQLVLLQNFVSPRCWALLAFALVIFMQFLLLASPAFLCCILALSSSVLTTFPD